ncbi:DUF488 family protein [Microbacterium esteraromaticum]|uniref:DUF488 domain-containing protein n=1 Tax=Microbacterium esteraromaticum TaxID=57043 RepID=UPI003C307EDB
MDLRRKRAYDTPSAEDGFRVLVDRLWPRGLSKQNAEIDLWAKDVTPTAELRREWHAAPASDFEIYAARYRAQLAADDAGALRALADELREHPVVTLVYAARDTEHNHVIVLEQALLSSSPVR